MKEIKFNLQYMLKKKEFYFTILITLLINMIQVIFVIYSVTSRGNVIENTPSAEYLSILYNPTVSFNVLNIIILPIIYSMVFSDSNWQEETGKITNMLYTRMDYKKNIITRFFLTFLITSIISLLGFLINYLLLRCLFPSGNQLSYFVEIGFARLLRNSWFLGNIRLASPVMFVILIDLSVSLVLGVISSFTYACSFFIKHRVIIYFIPFIYIVANEIILMILNLKDLSIVQKLQPFGIYSIGNYFGSIGITFLLGIILLIWRINKKDCLV